MKAVVFHGVGDIRIDDVAEPEIEAATDALIEVRASAICGTDLHLVRGTVPGMRPGTILGHEAVGVVTEVGAGVHNLSRGDRVVVASTIGCGSCSYCREGYFAQCDHSNPHGRRAGPTLFGGPRSSGSIPGLQAERARIPFANVGLVKVPDHVADDQALLLSDIFPTGYFGAELAEVKPGDVVAVFGCGPVGQFAILSAQLLGAGRVLAIDNVASRLEIAQAQGAEAINFDEAQPVQALLELTRGIGPDRVIDAVGVDARAPHYGGGLLDGEDEVARIERQRSQVSPEPWNELGQLAEPHSPVQALEWAVDAIAKAGTLAIIGDYPARFESFPLGRAFQKNLTVKMGVCHHRRYIPKLMQLIGSGAIDLSQVVPRRETLLSATEAYELFERHANGWLQVELLPG
jgi:threonine dehydrogenase-like Zn-dependent dehydrogenase